MSGRQANLPQRTDLEGRVWIVVATAAGPVPAAIIAGRLETERIPVFIYREPAGSAFGLTIGPLGQTEVLVPAAYYDQALAVLEAEDVEDNGAYLPDGDDE